MKTKSSDEIIKEFIQLPLSYIKYILSLLRGKQNNSDEDNIKLHFGYLILSFPMTILLLQFLHYFSNGELNIKLLSAINIYSYALFLISVIVWAALNYTILMFILLIIQKKLTIKSLKIAFLEPIKFYIIGSIFISLAMFLSLNELIINLRDIHDDHTFNHFMYENTWKTVLIVVMIFAILIGLWQTVLGKFISYFRFWFGKIISFFLALICLYATVELSKLTFKIVPDIIKVSPDSLIMKDEFCQQVIDAKIDQNQSCLENIDFKEYKILINKCKTQRIFVPND